MKKLGVVLILWACTLPLSGCAILETGPCYGTGCPVLHSKNAPTAAQNTPAQPAQDTTATATTPAQTQKKHHHKFWIL